MSGRETESSEDVEDYFIPDIQSLANLREKYCIQCLELLGQYVEALGPVLHENGVDVCLALLQQNSKHQEASKVALLLPDVMKLICVLAAHKKFAADFVDRGGMQKLLAVPRLSQTFYGLSSCLVTIGSVQVFFTLFNTHNYGDRWRIAFPLTFIYIFVCINLCTMALHFSESR